MGIESLLTKKGWQASGQLVQFNSTQEVKFQADFGDKVGYYTVQFNITLPPNVTDAVYPRAELIWSVEGGAFVKRLVSLGLGNSISGTGQAVRVRMFDFSENPAPAAPIVYEVSAQVTPGTRPNGGGSRPPILISACTPGTTVPPLAPIPNVRGPAFYQLVTGTAHIIPVPQDAGINSVLINASLPGANAANVIQQNGLVALLTDIGGFPVDLWNYPQFGTWKPIPPGVATITIDNASTFTVGVGVTWGIEG